MQWKNNGKTWYCSPVVWVYCFNNYATVTKYLTNIYRSKNRDGERTADCRLLLKRALDFQVKLLLCALFFESSRDRNFSFVEHLL